ncbi:MAG: hypothetical protein GY865_11140 [candidate division Zixibacteria bacterium]|nr:hypothetical protein [candidate division Zixibacteria bacterium]
MFCFKAKQRLIKYNWDKTIFGKDADLMKHIHKCDKCQNLIFAEKSIVDNLSELKQTETPPGLSFDALQQKLKNQSTQIIYKPKRRRYPKYVIGFVSAVILVLAFFPFNVTETVGYEVAISGIDRNIALNNQEVPSLLDALGMEPNKVDLLLDSMEQEDVYLSVGDCDETCDLKITELKTEHDARLVIKAIIELGCCEIEKLMPIIRSKPTNLFKQTTKQLFS